MIIRKCDCCGNSMDIWYTIDIKVDSDYDWLNLYPYILEDSRHEVCMTCVHKLLDVFTSSEEVANEKHSNF